MGINKATFYRFQSTLLMRGATASAAGQPTIDIFQSTLLMRGATMTGQLQTDEDGFQSTLLMRGATRAGLINSYVMNFNPRSSCEERPNKKYAVVESAIFQSTLLMRGATSQVRSVGRMSIISIHAPHARSDTNY